ncbi:MAG: divergent polysaccharide deacetylase family protein, partial [Alphaproteobacteria bacterium]|nr:divergent polysaccharide deacetylase family protein [Alphaproteobacteria bacterium]
SLNSGIGAVLMLLVEFFVMRGDRPYYHDPEDAVIEDTVEQLEDVTAVVTPTPEIMGPYGPVLDFEMKPETVEQAPAPLAQWQKNAVPSPDVPEGFGRVVVIIDDLGVDRKHSREILELPAPITAAFLPYADNVAPMVADARAAGHEIMIHMPMAPTNTELDMGSVALRPDMSPAEFEAVLKKAFSVFDGYVGMNNHMGSLLTQDRGAMERLMGRLYEQGLLFVDSRTIGSSIAGQVAADHSVPHAVRDVFLDHDPTYEGVVKSLKSVEDVARRNGTAIAIGHPKPATIRALQEWLPTLTDKKLVLVPVSAVVTISQPAVMPLEEDLFIAPDEQATAAAGTDEAPLIILPAADEW